MFVTTGRLALQQVAPQHALAAEAALDACGRRVAPQPHEQPPRVREARRALDAHRGRPLLAVARRAHDGACVGLRPSKARGVGKESRGQLRRVGESRALWGAPTTGVCA